MPARKRPFIAERRQTYHQSPQATSWVEAPDGRLVNLAHATNILRTEPDQDGSCEILVGMGYAVELERRDPSLVEDVVGIGEYDSVERAEEDLAKIRQLLNPLRLRPHRNGGDV